MWWCSSFAKQLWEVKLFSPSHWTGVCRIIYIHIYVRTELSVTRGLLRVNSSLIHNYSGSSLIHNYFPQVLFKKVRLCYPLMLSLFQQKHNDLSTGLKPIFKTFSPHKVHLNYFLKYFHWLCGIPGQNPLGQKRKGKHLLSPSTSSLPGW